ncbi:MAG: hypothetical protein [CRESS virus sp. ct0Vt4]|uniref:Uncharacterized protein n=1 Tax=CRESS virus sp. ct0Vt4 TaxID=2656673 RepID=A0A5Q2W615_9VIRU|nr:MAG: hypothetical protein [CRESS virus sp. ct0Vt4]
MTVNLSLLLRCISCKINLLRVLGQRLVLPTSSWKRLTCLGRRAERLARKDIVLGLSTNKTRTTGLVFIFNFIY